MDTDLKFVNRTLWVLFGLGLVALFAILMFVDDPRCASFMCI